VEAIEEAVKLARMPVEARAAYMAEMLRPVCHLLRYLHNVASIVLYPKLRIPSVWLVILGYEQRSLRNRRLIDSPDLEYCSRKEVRGALYFL
jgi:hypothetical protein